MHIDSFFEYCLGKAHPYYTQIPQGEPEDLRDGVPLEEDLALRALHPESRPKRGRRKAEDRNDEDDDKDLPTSKRQQTDAATPLDTLSAMEQLHSSLFTSPHSAVTPNTDMERYLGGALTPDPWSTTTPTIASLGAGSSTPSGQQQFRWRAFSKEATTPHPTSAPALSLDTPTDGPMTPTITTPLSAKPRSRRRHGPAVSSAWPSSGNPLTGKLRGRPPSNRSVRDGPFSTFPVNPSGKAGITIDLGAGATGTPTSTPVIMSNPPKFPPVPSSRPQGLHLQVPPRKPSTVTMASPIAPRQLNGASSLKLDATVEDFERMFAANLLQGSMVDLTIEDAKTIAHKAVADLRGIQNEETRTITSQFSTFPALKVLLGCEMNSSAFFKDFKIERILSSQPSLLRDQGSARGKYRLSWRIGIGPLNGKLTQVVCLDMGCGKNSANDYAEGSDEDENDDDDTRGFDKLYTMPNVTSGGARSKQDSDAGGGDDSSGDAFDWRKKYFEMEKRLREKENEIATIKRRVLHAVM